MMRRLVVAGLVLAAPAAVRAEAAHATGDKTTAFTADVAGVGFAFDGVVETMKLADPKGVAQAEIVTTSYLMHGDKSAETGRPITFVVNGGPGASSAWLNLGAIGPWRVPLGLPTDAPVAVANAQTWLAFTDLVFIDPPGTGFSRITGDEKAREQFYSVQGDIDTLAVVVRRWLEAHGRLLSKSYVAGESYGGFRAPKLARALLSKQGIAVSGLVMISPVLDFNGRESKWNPLREVAELPSMAAAFRRAQSRDAVRDVEQYAETGFLQDLLAGEADKAAIERLSAHVAALTGLDPALVRQRDGRVDVETFLRRTRPDQVASPYDATWTATDPFPEAANDNSLDPVLDGLRAPITRAMLHEYHDVLGWEPEGAPNRQYQVLNDDVAREWNYGKRQSRPEALTELRQYVALDPTVRVLVTGGLYDVVTPYFANVLLLRQSPQFGPSGQIRFLAFPGGHMFYSREESRAALSAAAKAVIAPEGGAP